MIGFLKQTRKNFFVNFFAALGVLTLIACNASAKDVPSKEATEKKEAKHQEVESPELVRASNNLLEVPWSDFDQEVETEQDPEEVTIHRFNAEIPSQSELLAPGDQERMIDPRVEQQVEQSTILTDGANNQVITIGARKADSESFDEVDHGDAVSKIDHYALPYEDFRMCPDSTAEDGLCAVNSYWLGYLAAYAYLKPSVGIPRFQAMGFDEVIFINKRRDHMGDFFYHDVQLYILKKDHDPGTKNGYIVLAFRGSESFNDWRVNFLANRQGFEGSGNTSQSPLAHAGFASSVNKVWPYIRDHIHRTDYLQSEEVPDEAKDDRRIYMTGHSLGGSLAHILMLRLLTSEDSGAHPHLDFEDPRIRSIYSMGSPRPVNGVSKIILEAYANRHKSVIARFRATKDPVAQIPHVNWGYRHVGLEVAIEYRGVNHRYAKADWTCRSDWTNLGDSRPFFKFLAHLGQDSDAHRTANIFKTIHDSLVREVREHNGPGTATTNCGDSVLGDLGRIISQGKNPDTEESVSEQISACNNIVYTDGEGNPIEL